MTPLHFAVIGWGYWGPKIARNLDSLPDSKVSIVADIDACRLASLATSRPELHTTTAVEDVLRSDVDAVVIATPVRTHYQLAKSALLYGKHVLVEKPMTTSVPEAEELIALASDQQRVLMVGQTFLYSPAVNEMRKLIHDGELGNIYCVEAERLSLGLYRNDINVIWDLAPHDISILLYLFHKEVEQIKVQAYTHLRTGVEDVAHLDLTYVDGMSAHIHVSWLHPRKIRCVTVIGDAKMVVYDDTNPVEMIKIYNEGAVVEVDPVVSYRFGDIKIPHIDWIEPLRLECEDFAHAIRTGEDVRSNGEFGLEVVRILAATQQVLQTQETHQVYVGTLQHLSDRALANVTN